MSTKKVTYTYDVAEVSKLIAKDLAVPVETIRVHYNLHDSSEEHFGRSPSYGVQDITVTVDMVKAAEEQNEYTR